MQMLGLIKKIEINITKTKTVFKINSYPIFISL